MFDPTKTIEAFDPEVAKALAQESQRQEEHIELIASENYASPLVMAAQGFTVLSLTYPGHHPPGGTWTVPITERQPIYLLDQSLPAEEVHDRNLKCTFNVILQGAGFLVDEHLAGRRLLAFGHSTGGPFVHTLMQRVENVRGLIGIENSPFGLLYHKIKTVSFSLKIGTIGGEIVLFRIPNGVGKMVLTLHDFGLAELILFYQFFHIRK